MEENRVVVQLLIEIDNFKFWSKTADKQDGQWETEYEYWNRIYYLTDTLLQTIPVQKWSLELMNEFLYILARDNECEEIIYEILKCPNQLIELGKYAVSFQDNEARWQIAYGLGEIPVNNKEVRALLQNFMDDENEYVRRRATFAYEKKFDN